MGISSHGVEFRIHVHRHMRQPLAAGLPDMEVFVDRSEDRIGHQHFHLANRHLLDVLVLGKGILDFRLATFRSFFELRVEDALLLDSHAAPHLSHPCARIQKILGCLFVFGAQHEGGIGGAGNVITEASADLKKLRCTLESE